MDFEEITEKLSQQPSSICRKGNSHVSKVGEKKATVYKEDCWLLQVEKDESQSFDDAINTFISKFKDVSEYIKELSSKFDVTLWVSAYPDEEQSNIHLSPNTVKLIADMGISVDFNVLFLKEFYEGNYKQ